MVGVGIGCKLVLHVFSPSLPQQSGDLFAKHCPYSATVLSDFVNMGLIKRDVFQSMLGNMRYQYYENSPPTWLDVIPGTFDDGYVLPDFQ